VKVINKKGKWKFGNIDCQNGQRPFLGKRNYVLCFCAVYFTSVALGPTNGGSHTSIFFECYWARKNSNL